MLAQIDHADPARSAEQAADAAAAAAGVQLSERLSIVEIWCPEAKNFEPARASGEKLLDDFHRSNCSLIHAYLANTAAAVHASDTCSVHESGLLTSAAAAAAAAAEARGSSRLEAAGVLPVVRDDGPGDVCGIVREERSRPRCGTQSRSGAAERKITTTNRAGRVADSRGVPSSVGVASAVGAHQELMG